jgi:hypothetical protein
MNKLLKKSLLNLAIISILLFLACYFILNLYFPLQHHELMLFVPIYFGLISSFYLYDLDSYFKKFPKRYHIRYMAWFGIKIAVHLIFIILTLVFTKIDKLAFVLIFGINYIIYTFYTVRLCIKLQAIKSDKNVL